MSRMAELWEELYGDKPIEVVEVDISEELRSLTEKERCQEYGIACSYGICSECDIAERS